MVHLATSLTLGSVLLSLLSSVAVAAPVRSEDGQPKAHRARPSGGKRKSRGTQARNAASKVRLNTQEGSALRLAERSPEPFLPFIGMAMSGISAISKIAGRRRKRRRDLGDLTSEELDIISRAEPEELAYILSRGLPAVKRDELSDEFAGVLERYFDDLDLELRELEDAQELEMRGYYDEDELSAREWLAVEELD